jgi:hypothetical protein
LPHGVIVITPPRASDSDFTGDFPDGAPQTAPETMSVHLTLCDDPMMGIDHRNQIESQNRVRWEKHREMRTAARGRVFSSFIRHSLIRSYTALINWDDRFNGPTWQYNTSHPPHTTESSFPDAGPKELASSAGDLVATIDVDGMTHLLAII